MLNPAKWQVFEDPDGTVQTVKRLLSENIRAYIPRYALAFVFMGLVAASTAASAWIMKDIINEVFINRDKAMIYVIAGVVIGIFTLKGASTYGQMVVLSRVGNAIVADLQQKLFTRLTDQDQAYFDRMSLPELAIRVNTGSASARNVIDMLVLSLGRDILTLIGLVVVLISMDPIMSLLALVIMPPIVIGVSFLVKRVKTYAKRQVVSNARIGATLQETVLGIRIVKAFGMEPAMRKRMAASVSEVQSQSNKIASLTARTSPLMETLGGFAIALVIFYGGYSVVELGRDPGAFFAFITALLLAYDPARRLARLNVNLSKAIVGVRLMYELIDEEPDIVKREDAPDLKADIGEVTLQDVQFSYGEGAALNGLSLTAEGGKTTALVGASGAGKSTVFALIERFYDPQAGEIFIDGQPIKSVSMASLRRNIAYVGQDSYLFNISLRDNIAVGKPDATQAEIEAAARAANAHEFILDLPNGYDMLPGEGGGRLSGGQRQRIAIARAMLRDAPILLLDEATSALDAESEAKIQSALETLMAGRTTLVIAHRLSTVRHAHRIHVLDRGRVVESGSHEALFEHDGIYRRLCELQFQNRDEAAE
ncbi:MAG: ABC transporter ATP-binding protein [Roseibium sp.]